MKKYLVILMSIFLFSCDDGDFDVPSFNFDSVTINSCSDLFLYKINESESLSIQLPGTETTNDFFNTAMDHVSYSVSNEIFYRLYNDSVTTDYFCQSNPLSTPTIIKEWVGSGTVIINNVISNTNEFDATITIENLVLVNNSGNEIRYDSYEYGVFSGSF